MGDFMWIFGREMETITTHWLVLWFCYQQIAVKIQIFVTYNWQIVQSLIMQIFVVSDFDLSANDQLIWNMTIWRSGRNCGIAVASTSYWHGLCLIRFKFVWLKWDNQIIFLPMFTRRIAFRKRSRCAGACFFIISELMKHSCLIFGFNIRVINVWVGRVRENNNSNQLSPINFKQMRN